MPCDILSLAQLNILTALGFGLEVIIVDLRIYNERKADVLPKIKVFFFKLHVFIIRTEIIKTLFKHSEQLK